ncbi:NADPH-dependent glutamate synthase GltA1 [Butyrivibrio proteoclasticus B316]|uniref:NADPH-dependent glutamate synthase GltA1 n=1 Tax=Butyrivibrio proteoclasticus (strain ATCC 51982 / DSM 14932 / B316) TaxID=515622 RepID=E0S1L4_BUTPB|nr:NAD(P)-dependent oxidoreductase [Butyrivibrio proteoclasticus]ADL33689.1 NADPH-dependent glutamate synthase GltA1 [Butyrivibrio proteoclasticus B316]
MSVHVIDEASRCLQCPNPRCRENGCPIHTNIPEMIRLFKENKMMEAAEMLFENNPLSMICSLVCNHENQCEGNCVRGIKGDPIHISSIENYISDSCFERLELKKAPSNGIKAAVIGAGPAGITIAIILALKGYSITVFETHDKIGGILRYGIPEFRLPKSILDRYYVKMRELGIKFRPNFSIGGSTNIQDLLNDGYKSVFIGTGAWRPRKLGIPGETFGNVYYAINYLNNPDVYDLGDKVAIIGAGNAAMDVARTAIRHGSRDVTVYVRGQEVSASKQEFEYAKVDGVKFEYNMSIVRIEDDGPVFKMEDGEKLIPADSILIAISQVPQDRIISKEKNLKLNEKGNLATNELGETTIPGVFASGDVVTGAKTVVAAVAVSKQIAEDMHKFMQTN